MEYFENKRKLWNETRQERIALRGKGGVDKYH